MNEVNIDYGVEFFFEYVIGKHKIYLEDRLRWQHLNDSTSLLLKAKGYEKAPMFNDILTKFDNADKPKQKEKTDEEIIAETLALFNK